MTNFALQPAESELQHLADQYWQQACDKERQLESAAFEAGAAIRHGEYTLDNLEAIVRWRSECAVVYLIGNSNESIRRALIVAASPNASTSDAVPALMKLRGIDLTIASAILAAIYPERYAVLDFRALEALGQARQDVRFYEEYLACCRSLAVHFAEPQTGLPGSTPLQAVERALTQWSASRQEATAPVAA